MALCARASQTTSSVTDPSNTSPTPSDPTSTTRFYLKNLQDEDLKKQFIQLYEEMSPIITSVLTSASSETLRVDPEHRLALVDSVDQVLSEVIFTCCETHLGTYEVKSIKKTPDHLTEKLSTTQSMTNAIRIFKRAQRGSQPRIVPSQMNVSVVSEARSLFSSVYDSSLPSLDFSDLLEHSQTTGDFTLGAAEDQDLLSFFTEKKLKSIISRYPKHKSPGPDSIHARIYSTLSESPTFLSNLCSFFHLCIKQRTTPSSWNVSNTCLLAKENGPECPVTRTRPVSLTNMARRYFESIFLRKIQNLQPFQLHKNQAGFKRGFSTITQILLANETCSLPDSMKHHTSIYLDLEKAFDRILHRPLLQDLKKRGCCGLYLSLIHSLMMRDCRSHLIVNGYRTEAIRRNRGVFQGSILAPLLFNIAIDSLAHTLGETEDPKRLPYFLFFADDIRLSAHPTEAWRLEIALYHCEKWAQRYGLRFGMSKCGIIGYDHSTFTLQGSSIPQVTSYKYLGLEFTKDGIDWRAYTDRIIKKSQGSLKFLFVKASDDWSHSIRLALVKTYVLSLLQYALGIYGHWSKMKEKINQDYYNINEQLSTIHKETLEFVFGFSTPISVLESISNLKNPQDTLTLARCSTTNHLKKTHESNPISSANHFLRNDPQLFLTYSRHSLILQCFSDPNYDKWQQHCTSLKAMNPDSQVPTLKTFILNLFEEQRAKNSILVRYISPTSRTNQGRLDKCLFIRDKGIRDKAIKWRAAKHLVKRSCDICLTKITRTHSTVCEGLTRARIVTRVELEAFSEERTRRRRSQRYGSKDNLTILDWYLNKQRLEDFIIVLDFLYQNSSAIP